MRDTAIESSVVTKVKGFGRYANRVMDVSDYVTPPQVWCPYPGACGCPHLGRVGRRELGKKSAPGTPKAESVVSVTQAEPPQPPSCWELWGSLGLTSRVQHWASGKLGSSPGSALTCAATKKQHPCGGQKGRFGS